MRKKVLSVALLLALIVSMCSISAFAADGDTSAIKVETVAEVLTQYAGGEFTFEEKKIDNVNITIVANEEITSGDKTYEKGDTVDTGKSGGTFNLPDGEYKAVANGSKIFKTSDAQIFGVSGENKTVTITAGKSQKHDIEVKNAKEGFTYKLEAAEDIKDYKGYVICPKDTVIKSLSGTDALFEDLPIETTYNGKYKVSESKTADGYFPADPQTAAGDDDKEVSFKDKTTKTTFKLVDKDGKDVSADGFKMVIVAEGEEEEKELTDMTVNALKAGGTYTIKSTETATGYLPFEQEFTVAEDDKEKIVKVEVDFTKVSLSVLDTDEEQSFVAGCSLVLMQGEKKIQTYTSGKTAKTLTKLAPGEYTLEMTHAPKGYCVGDPVNFTVEETDEAQEIVMKVVRPKGYVAITLVSVVNRTPLDGAEFEFKDADGNVISKVTTDAKGQAKTDLVEIGLYKNGEYTGRATYKLQETKSKDGFVCDKTEYKLLFDYVDDQTPEVHIEATLPNRSVTDEPVKTKLVAKQVPGNAANQRGGFLQTGDKRMLLILAGIIVIIALLCVTFIPPALQKKKLKQMQEMDENKETPAGEERRNS